MATMPLQLGNHPPECDNPLGGIVLDAGFTYYPGNRFWITRETERVYFMDSVRVKSDAP